jgi:hypothetical protein
LALALALSPPSLFTATLAQLCSMCVPVDVLTPCIGEWVEEGGVPVGGVSYPSSLDVFEPLSSSESSSCDNRTIDHVTNHVTAKAHPPLSHLSAVPVAPPSFSLSLLQSDDANVSRIIKE